MNKCLVGHHLSIPFLEEVLGLVLSLAIIVGAFAFRVFCFTALSFITLPLACFYAVRHYQVSVKKKVSSGEDSSF